MSTQLSDKQRRHWSRTSNLNILVLVIWFIVSFVVNWFAKDLNAYTFIGFPLGYYMAAQGSLIIFVLLIFFQNFAQDAIDRDAGLNGE